MSSSLLLDGLLNDLELACQERTPETSNSHLETRTATTSTSETFQHSTGVKDDTQRVKPVPIILENQQTLPPVPQRDETSRMATTAISSNAVANNLNELDVLLQDLSNARFAPGTNMLEQRSESKMMTSSSSTSYQSSGFYPSDHNRSNSSERKSPGVRSAAEDAVIKEMSSKIVEKHEESSHTLVSSTLNEQTKWEYIGKGVWENGDKQHTVTNGGGGPPPPAPPIRHETRKTPVDTLNLATSYHQSSRHKASSATQELDDLMQSLNTFKLREGATEEPVITNLDDMLGNLQEDMVKQGVKTTQKGVCYACDKPIVGQVVTALGKTFHPEHFTCAHCNQELGTQNFFEREDQPYCEDDYHSLFSPRCAHCNGAILDKCISALDRQWHPEHFVCFDCNKPFGDDGFHEKDDQAFCNDCYQGMFAPRCAGCSLPITENYISSLDAQWHPNCFVCLTCRQPFADGNFFEHEGSPYCETHFHALKGSLCAGCAKPISGRCITAMFRKFHPEHFVCSFCLKQLNKGTFKENGEKPYCHECFNRLFG